MSYFFLQQSIAKPFEALHILTANNISKLTIKFTVTYDNFVAILTKLVLSRPRGSSETFLLGKRVGHRAQGPVRYQNDDSSLALYRLRIPDSTNSQVKINNKVDSYL